MAKAIAGARSILAVALLSGLIGFVPPRADAQATGATAPSGPRDGQLDALLTAHDWNGLGAALSRSNDPRSMLDDMNWMHNRLNAGGGFFLGLLYARDLWMMGQQANIADPDKDMRVTAGMIALYTYELIVIDGAKCQDQSAPGHRLDQLLQVRGATFAYLKTLPSGTRGKIVDIAIALEQKTAPLRPDDDLLCRGGMAQMMAGLKNGSQQPVPSAPGVVGRSVAVTPPPDWSPALLPPSQYQPAQAKSRARMKEALLKLVQA